MITKGIVEKIVNEYQVKIRMPFIDGIKDNKHSTPTELLSNATICTIPNSRYNLYEGDIVFIGFEDNDIGKPIILGQLYKEHLTNSILDLNVRKLNVSSNCILPKETYIGDISPVQLKMLSGLTGNIQSQLDDLYDKIKKLSEE